MDAIRAAAAELRSGDIFLFSFAGHGHGIRDENGDEEGDQDEAFCIYDGAASAACCGTATTRSPRCPGGSDDLPG